MIGLRISLSGIQAGLARLNVAANNISNSTTPAFKPSHVDQVDIAGGGTSIGSVRVRFNQGPLEVDDGRFSLAVEGDGFFRVQTPQGDRFVRNGSFHVDAEGQIVTSDGGRLGITVPTEATSYHVSSDGTVSALMPGGQAQTAGRIELVRFANPGGLSAGGSATPASGPPREGAPGSALVFGALEGSGVDLGKEMADLIVAKALVKANIAALKVQGETLGELFDLRG